MMAIEKKFKEITEILEGCQMQDIGRAVNMAWFGFSTGENHRDHHLHIQCPWRMRKDDELIVGSNDIFEVLPGKPVEEWDEVGNNFFDEIIREKEFESIFPLKVEHAEITKYGDIKIICKGGYYLEVFIDSTVLVENWRFLNNKTDEHIVFLEIDDEEDGSEE